MPPARAGRAGRGRVAHPGPSPALLPGGPHRGRSGSRGGRRGGGRLPYRAWVYPGRPTAGRDPARRACGPALRHPHRTFRRGRPSRGLARPGGDRVRRLAVPFLEAMPQAVPCENRARHPAVPGCRCPARPARRPGGQARTAARTWHRDAGRSWSPKRDRPWDPFPADGRPMKDLHADRHQRPAVGRYPVPRADQRQVSRASQRRNPGGAQHQDPRASRSQNPGPHQHPEPGVGPDQDACADRHCRPQAGRSQDQGWCPKGCASRHLNPGAGRYLSPGVGRHCGPQAGRSQDQGWYLKGCASLRRGLGADRHQNPGAGWYRHPGVGRSHDADRRRHVRRCRCAGHRRGVGLQVAGYRSGAGQGHAQGRRACPAGTARQSRPPGHPRQGPGRCRWLASANASPERASNRCRSCSLSSPRTPRWLPPRPVGSHSIMKHQPIPRPPFAPATHPPADR